MAINEPRRRASALGILAILALAAMPSLRPIDAAAAAVTITTAYTTGYTWFDNSPPGNDICCGVIHPKAAGTGTYADPISLAAGLVPSGGLDYAAGTRFYMPDVRRYFIVEDSCGNVGSGGCHFLNSAPAGATTWLDRWVGGTANDSKAAVQGCADYLTDENGSSPLHTLVENPPSNLAVVPGPLFQNGHCTPVYGNGSAPPAPPPTQPPAPPPTQPPVPPPTATPVSHTPTPGSTPLPPVAAAPAGHTGAGTSAVPGAKQAQTQSTGPNSPSHSASRTVAPLVAIASTLGSVAFGDLAPAALALVLTVLACAGWLLWRRRSRIRDPGSQ